MAVRISNLRPSRVGGFGMHWRLTEACVPPAYELSGGHRTSLVQGLLPIAGRFERASVHDGIYAMHLAIFGQSS